LTLVDWILDPDVSAELFRRLLEAKSVLLPTHQNTDADGLGSALSLVHAMRARGVEATALISDGQMPKSLAFLPGIETVAVYGVDPLPDYDLICMVDCSDKKRLGAFYTDDPERVSGAIPILNIDHHVTNSNFGIVNMVIPTASSTAEIIARLMQRWGVRYSTDIAQCLLAGIWGDTLGLRTDSTTARTMRTAADLVDAGAQSAAITEALFNFKPRSTVCLWEHALRDIQWTGALIWTEIKKQTLHECKAEPAEAEGIVNFLAGAEGSRAGAILHETDKGWRVSLRSSSAEVDVAAIAAEFGGGGHPRAAGCQLQGGEAEKTTFLERVAELIAAPVGAV
jgi:phosphoesterase RecJ-like protein